MGIDGLKKKQTKELLCLLPMEDLVGLAQTVTNRTVTFENVKEVINAILTCSSSVEELLRRRKITRNVLLKYLINRGINVDTNLDKNQLCSIVIEQWCRDDKQVVSRSFPVSRSFSEPPRSQAHLPKQQHTPPPTQSQTVSPTHSMHVPITVSSAPVVTVAPPINLDELSHQFTAWFYNMLNTSDINTAASNNFHSPHFYSDCKMKLLIVTKQSQIQELFEGDDKVCQALLQLLFTERLVLNPNLDLGGIEVASDVHGLYTIHVKGTVHQENVVKGLFQQQFGLIKDPYSGNNFRIKYTNLCITEQ